MPPPVTPQCSTSGLFRPCLRVRLIRRPQPGRSETTLHSLRGASPGWMADLARDTGTVVRCVQDDLRSSRVAETPQAEVDGLKKQGLITPYVFFRLVAKGAAFLTTCGTAVRNMVRHGVPPALR